jgi:hypothetical protein
MECEFKEASMITHGKGEGCYVIVTETQQANQVFALSTSHNCNEYTQ